MTMDRVIRYQGAILRGDHLLLIKHHEHDSGREYWILPGGGREPDESEEDCVKREMLEETGLNVLVEKLILEDTDLPLGIYKQYKTYLCRVIDGEAMPGYEPEADAAQSYAISEVRWFDLKDSNRLEAALRKEPFTFPLVQRIRSYLGYRIESSAANSDRVI
ncbi:MAG: NUDIX hydrolase [Anaerolineaceae bacterium]|nr:NUDIX hydrolase [Anaerolineaceae bacterium]